MPAGGNWPYLLCFCILDNKKGIKGLQGHKGGPSLGLGPALVIQWTLPTWPYNRPNMNLYQTLLFSNLLHDVLSFSGPLNILENLFGPCGTKLGYKELSWTFMGPKRTLKQILYGPLIALNIKASKNLLNAEMEYCESAASMLAEEIWQIVEGFVEVHINLQAQLKKFGRSVPND